MTESHRGRFTRHFESDGSAETCSLAPSCRHRASVPMGPPRRLPHPGRSGLRPSRRAGVGRAWKGASDGAMGDSFAVGATPGGPTRANTASTASNAAPPARPERLIGERPEPPVRRQAFAAVTSSG